MNITLNSIALCMLMGVAAYCDVKARLIPNNLIIAGLVAAFGLALAGPPGMTGMLLGGLIGGLSFLVLYMRGGMGAGDVKLMAVAGMFLGPHGAFLAVIMTALAGALVGIVYTVKDGREARIPYALAIVAGSLLSAFWGNGLSIIV